MNIKKYFDLAASIADFNDNRTFMLGAVGIRSDGVLVCARNGNSFSTKWNSFHKNIKSHAEGRILRKLDCDSTIFISRIKDKDTFVKAKPCDNCAVAIKGRRVYKVYYTIDDECFGLWYPKQDKTIIYNF